MKEYKFPHADAALAFLKNHGFRLFCAATGIVPANLKGYPTYPDSNTPWPFARLYGDKLVPSVSTENIGDVDLSVLEKYQRKLVRALKKEKIPLEDSVPAAP